MNTHRELTPSALSVFETIPHQNYSSISAASCSPVSLSLKSRHVLIETVRKVCSTDSFISPALPRAPLLTKLEFRGDAWQKRRSVLRLASGVLHLPSDEPSTAPPTRYSPRTPDDGSMQTRLAYTSPSIGRKSMDEQFWALILVKLISASMLPTSTCRLSRSR